MGARKSSFVCRAICWLQSEQYTSVRSACAGTHHTTRLSHPYAAFLCEASLVQHLQHMTVIQTPLLLSDAYQRYRCD